MRGLGLLLVLVSSACAMAQERSGFLTSGSLPPSKLSAITADGALVLERAGKTSTVPKGSLVLWGAQVEPKRGPLILLSDGSSLVGEPIALSGEELRIDARLFGEIPLPRSIVRGIIYRLPAEPARFDRLVDRILSRREAGDLLLLANGDELTGRASGQRLSEETSEEQLLFAVGSSNQATPLGLSKLAALAFDSVLVDETSPTGAYVRCGLRDGSCLSVAAASDKAGRYELTLASGLKLRIAGDALSEDIVYWQPQGSDTVTYLSDLNDAGYKHIPFLTETWSFRKDRNCHGDRLRAGGALFAKGLGMRSTSRLAFDLDADYRRFAAELAIDASAGERGSVIFRVFTAGTSGGWKEAYESPIVRGGDAPLPIDVDLSGVTRLALIVSFAERGDECDDANWLNVRLVK